MKKITVSVFLICVLFMCLFSANAQAYSAYGSRGAEVLEIQKHLADLGLYDEACDGIYGTVTRDAVAKYQKMNDLSIDGIAGGETLGKMEIIIQSDLELLAMVINGEARGESFEGQVAVGAVVLNRVEHPAFPDTLQGVVYQKGAFCAVADGQINIKVTDSCKRAAKAALEGADPTDGAVYYYNPETATCKWIRTRSVVKRIGNHLFCV